MTDTKIINWMDRFDCVEIRLTPDAGAEYTRTICAGALIGDYGSGTSIRHAVIAMAEREMTDTEILNWIDSFGCVEIRLTPDASSEYTRTIYASALAGGCGSGISIRDAVIAMAERDEV